MADPSPTLVPSLTVESALLEVAVDLVPFIVDALADSLRSRGADSKGFGGIGLTLAGNVLTAEKSVLVQLAAAKLRASAPSAA